ncbi:MAG: energy-coupling factor transporter transmembrane protein EcfT [Clostridia bacterium]|nr:energy-coupling factor transporter transmembrane protein EcfT [Clostridia bacterium]
MIKDITIGQYYPYDSPIHRLDPRLKLILVILLIVIIFVAQTPAAYLCAATFVAVAVALSHIPVKLIVKGLKPILFIIVITTLLNLFYSGGEPIWSFWIISISKEGIWRTATMLVRVVLLVIGTSLLTYTTSPIMLTDGLERLLSPLKKIKLPVHEFSLMMTIALRFIPTLIEEVDKISSAQKARGSDLETGNLIQRAKALVPILVPLFVSSFRRADELAVAMECRCYRGGAGRTRLRQYRLHRRDAVAAAVSVSVLAAVILCNIFIRWGVLV